MIVARGIKQITIQFPPALEVGVADGVVPHCAGHGGETARGPGPYIALPVAGVGTEIISGSPGQSGEGLAEGARLGVGGGEIRIPGSGIGPAIVVPPVEDKISGGVSVAGQGGLKVGGGGSDIGGAQ